MLVGELKQKLNEMPDDAYIYLDDHKMPTPMGLVTVKLDTMTAFEIVRDEEGKISREKSVETKVDVVTLTTYKIPEGGWAAESSNSSDPNGKAGTRSKSKKKKSKKK